MVSFSLPTPRVLKEIVNDVTERMKVALSHISTILGYDVFPPEVEADFRVKLEKKIRTIYLFNLEAPNINKDEVKKLCKEITNLVWMKGVVPNDRVNWYVWSVNDPLGLIIRSAEIRIKLLENQPITATELAIISNTSSGNISHHIRTKNIKAFKNNEDNREWLIEAQEAIRYLRTTRADIASTLRYSYPSLEEEVLRESQIYQTSYNTEGVVQ